MKKMKIKLFLPICLLFVLLLPLTLTSCFSLKDSPFYNSEWIMQNLDNEGKLYYHHLIFSADKTVMLRASYTDSTNILVWTGTYKINSKKITFDFTNCQRYENGQVVGEYKAGSFVKFYTGDFFYSVAPIVDDDGNERYHLELIRPVNYFYGENKDIFGNHLEEFIRWK